MGHNDYLAVIMANNQHSSQAQFKHNKTNTHYLTRMFSDKTSQSYKNIKSQAHQAQVSSSRVYKCSLNRHQQVTAFKLTDTLRMIILAVVLTLLAITEEASSLNDNIALVGKAQQSSLDIWNGIPQRAIDGNRASNWLQNSCTHTNRDMNPWWRLDLQKTYKINTVIITNRRDCCHERLNGAELRIGDSLDDNGNANPRCTVILSISAGQSKTFECNGMEGRYVNIVIPGRREHLTLCEVEVYGEEANENFSDTCS
nr:fucolectin [Syngnathus scovelli]